LRNFSSILMLFILLATLASAQENTTAQEQNKKVPPHPTRSSVGPTEGVSAAPQQLAQRQAFALNVLQSAVAIPQNDPQDRLRVLVSAARLANSVSPEWKKKLAREGIELESRLIGSGQQPQVSMVASGFVDCAAVSELVEAIRPEAMLAADQTISAAVRACPKQSLPAVERKLADALQHGAAPPRTLIASMQGAGAKSNWTLQEFDTVFSNLPDPKVSAAQAPLFASLYENFAGVVDTASARNAGTKLLVWLGKMDTSPERVQAATTAVRAMKKVLGDKRYQEIVESDPIASQAAQLAGQPAQMPLPDEEQQVQIGRLDLTQDHTGDLENYPAPRRAREAAAYGFAVGNAGDKQLAQRYFDIAFGALNEVWSNRLPGMNVAATIEEVSQAAANVDPVAALQHAERLQESSTQAISMLAVAETVLNRQTAQTRPKLAQR
jgi:hypothetical protein